ncbi:MAG: helix-turn-helix transcriptional regulator [Kurthia sp.]
MYYNLYIARKEHRMKQAEVARKLGIHSVTYSRKERCELEFSLNEAFVLSKLFEVPVEELFEKR